MLNLTKLSPEEAGSISLTILLRYQIIKEIYQYYSLSLLWRWYTARYLRDASRYRTWPDVLMIYLLARCRHRPCTIFTTRITSWPFSVAYWASVELYGKHSMQKITFPISEIQVFFPYPKSIFRYPKFIFRYRKFIFGYRKFLWFSDIGKWISKIGNYFCILEIPFRISENSDYLHGILAIELEPLQLLYIRCMPLLLHD